MINAIEQAKREMYDHLESVKVSVTGIYTPTIYVKRFEEFLESYLELLRQDHEALHETARKRFEDIQGLEEANAELSSRLSLMTMQRDILRNRQQASDHAQEASNEDQAIRHQDSGDRDSCAAPDAKTMALLVAVVDLERIVGDYAMTGLRAKKAMKLVAGIVNGVQVHSAMKEFESPGMYYEIICNTQYDDGVKTTRSLHKGCMHSFFAIGQDQMKCTFCGVGK